MSNARPGRPPKRFGPDGQLASADPSPSPPNLFANSMLHMNHEDQDNSEKQDPNKSDISPRDNLAEAEKSGPSNANPTLAPSMTLNQLQLLQAHFANNPIRNQSLASQNLSTLANAARAVEINNNVNLNNLNLLNRAISRNGLQNEANSNPHLTLRNLLSQSSVASSAHNPVPGTNANAAPSTSSGQASGGNVSGSTAATVPASNPPNTLAATAVAQNLQTSAQTEENLHKLNALSSLLTHNHPNQVLSNFINTHKNKILMNVLNDKEIKLEGWIHLIFFH